MNCKNCQHEMQELTRLGIYWCPECGTIFVRTSEGETFLSPNTVIFDAARPYGPAACGIAIGFAACAWVEGVKTGRELERASRGVPCGLGWPGEADR